MSPPNPQRRSTADATAGHMRRSQPATAVPSKITVRRKIVNFCHQDDTKGGKWKQVACACELSIKNAGMVWKASRQMNVNQAKFTNAGHMMQ